MKVCLRKFCSMALSIALAAPMAAVAQQGAPLPAGQQQPPAQPQTSAADQLGDRVRPNYELGANDQIIIREPNTEEINDRPFRIDAEGFLTLPILGRVKASGLTVQQLEQDLNVRLKAYVKAPQAIITVVQFRSEPVFFVGAFKAPGIYPLQGRRTLVEMLSTIGGLQPYAARRIRLTRRLDQGPIPLPNANVDNTKQVSTVDIGMGSLRENVNPAEDIVLKAFDVVTVDRAELVYVNGDVGHVGAFEVGERDSISVIQLLTLAGGLGKDAHAEQARVLRPVLDTSRRAEIPINIPRILKGEAKDFPLLPNDILYVPHKKGQWTSKALPVLIPLIPTAIVLLIRK